MQFNHNMRIISSTVRSTQIIWLLTFSNIACPDLIRLSRTIKILHELKIQLMLPLQIYILGHPPLRLKSRAPIWHEELQSESVEYLWMNRWKQTEPYNRDLIKKPFIKEIPRVFNRSIIFFSLKLILLLISTMTSFTH